MVSTKNAIFSFFFFFLVKSRLEIVFQNILDRKETFFGHKNYIPTTSQKSHIFGKGVNP